MKRIIMGDTVILIAGKDKGYVGKVTAVTKNDRVIVEGANMLTKHVKPTQNDKGGIIKREASIHCSNVALYNPKTQKADKVGFQFIEKDGEKRKVRYFKSNNEVIDAV